DAISGFKSGKIAQQRGHLVYAVVKLLVGNGNRRNIFRLTDEDKCRLVAIFFQMTVHAVVTGVELASGIPLPERGVTGIERGVPIVVPAQKVGIFTEAFGKVFFAEALINGTIGQVSLACKF